VLKNKRLKIESMFAAYKTRHAGIRYTNGTRILFRGQNLELKFVPDIRYAWKLEDTLIINQKYQEHTHLVLKDFYKAQAGLIHNRCIDLAKQHHLMPQKISLRYITSRWGSCSRAGNISLSIFLIMAPPEVAEYVIIHELAHLKHHNHSPEYWSLVAELAPEFRQHRAWLKQNSHLLRIPDPEL